MTKRLVNIVSNKAMLEPFKDEEGLLSYIEADCRCDGAEVISCPIEADDMVGRAATGYHLMFYPNWIDFYNNNTAYLEKHFGGGATWLEYYGCRDALGFEQRLTDDLDRAERLHAEYAVFHCADISNEEVLQNYSLHSNKEVIRATATLLNKVLRNKSYSFYILIENLFVTGMTLMEPGETELMLSLIDYDRKGVMLDAGHLMAALRLRHNGYPNNEAQAAEAIESIISAHGRLKEHILGMHLHKCSLTMPISDYLSPIEPDTDFYTRSSQSYARIMRLDAHAPLETDSMNRIIDAVEPRYIVHELSAASPEAKAKAVCAQLKALKQI